MVNRVTSEFLKWKCPKCDRLFERSKQPHSCTKFPLENHFINKIKTKKLFDSLCIKVNRNIGKCNVISLPCCIHLYGTYDFLAALPKKDHLEIRFGLDHVISGPRFKDSVPLSKKLYKNCINIKEISDIDNELLGWLDESFHIKEKIKNYSKSK